jgi:ketosteroid isomerase-like protein
VASSNLELVRALYERFRPDDPDALLELLSEDFVAEVPPSMSAEPDVYEGHEGALRYLRGFAGMIEDVRFELLDIFEEDECVIACLRMTGRGASSGIEVELPTVVVHRVADGKVTRMHPFPDVDAAREALGRLGEESAS